MTTSTGPARAPGGEAEYEEPRWLRIAAVPAMLTIGALVALQSQINSELATRLGASAVGGITAALISFGSGLGLLTAGAAVSASMRRGLGSVRSALHSGALRRWHVVGGAAGAFLVAAQGLTVGTIGVALFTVAVVAGQTASSLAVDQVGIGPSGAHAVSTTRVLGAVLTVAAVALSASERLGGSDALAVTALALALLPLLAGAGIAWQQAINGQVSRRGGPWAAAWINFAVGTAVLAVATLVAVVVQGPAAAPPGTWWLYTGGVLGVAFISAAAVLVRVHGVLVLGLCTVCGQVSAALVIDQVVDAGDLGAATVTGAVLTLLGVLLAGLGGRRSTDRRGRRRAISDTR